MSLFVVLYYPAVVLHVSTLWQWNFGTGLDDKGRST